MTEPAYRRDFRAIGSGNTIQERLLHESEHRTPTCGQRLCRALITDGGGTYRCAACAQQQTDEWLEERRADLDEETPRHFRWATRSAPDLAERVKPAMAIAQAFDAVDTTTIVLIGPAGAGKTSLGRALWFERRMASVRPASREWPDQRRERRSSGDPEPGRAMFVTTFELAKARREHKLGDGEAEIIDRATRSVLLLLDELGSETGKGDTAVSEVIHARHAADRATIYCTPYGLVELKNRFGDGVARRVFEGAAVIKLGA
jgi:DNA replication protein DnaC